MEIYFRDVNQENMGFHFVQILDYLPIVIPKQLWDILRSNTNLLRQLSQL